jgi:DNA repair protein RecN (Recombination protein N)
MLQYLTIENFAIVEQLELHLDRGLTIISGETGAGKSILIDALGLVLGERADSSVVRQEGETAQVNATFVLSPLLQTWLQQQKVRVSNNHQCQVRRVIHHNGRSRGFINDTPVSVQILRKLGEYLVDIHGQHAHQSLLKHEIQRSLLDDMIEDSRVLESVKQAYQHWKSLQTTLNLLGGQDREAKLALLRYQVQELEQFELTPATIQTLEEEHQRLAHASKLLENSQQALALLDAEDSDSTLSYLARANRELDVVQKHDTQLNGIITLLDNAVIQTQEAVRELRHYLSKLEIDPARLQEVERQIGTLQDLARKHKIRVIDLPAYFERLSKELQELENYEQSVSRLEQEIAEASQTYHLVAEELHEQRLQTAQPLAEQITAYMHQLGMPGGQLVIAVSADEDAPPAATGMDIVEFLVSTNPGHPPKPLQKVASGGELSRISLAIQVITAQSSGVPILVFDEVDVGIGGGTAEIVGQMLRRLGLQRQVLCITHLPQVACQGHHHLQVTKTISQQTTHTRLKWLDDKQRVEEIARMLGGVEITSQTLAHAQEMLQRCLQQ